MLTDDRTAAPDAPAAAGPPDDRRAAWMPLLVTPAALAAILAVAAVVGRELGQAAGFALAVTTGGVVGLTVAPRLRAAYIGVAAWAATSAVVTVVVLHLATARKHTLSRALGMLAIGIAAVVGGWLWARVRSRQATLAGAVREAAEVFTRPARPAAAALLGAGMALPLIGTYGAMIGESDSAWIAVSTQRVRADGTDLLQQNQDVFLPHLTVGPLLALDGYRAAILFTIAALVALVALAAYLGQRITGRAAGAVAAAAALLAMSEIVARANRLPMYALTFVFGYGAAWLLHLAMGRGGRDGRRLAVLGGLGVVLAFEAHSVGQLFLLVPFLVLILHPWSRSRGPFGVALATIVVASIPRVVVNLSVGGLESFRSNYTDFMIGEGYLTIVNRDFWRQNLDTTPVGYLTNLPGLLESAIGARPILLLAVPAALAAVLSGRRARVFVAASAGIFVAALTIASPGTYARYLTPLAVGFALVAAVGIARSLAAGGEARTLGHILLAAVVAGGFFSLTEEVTQAARLQEAIVHGPSPRLAGLVDDDRAVIGVRSHEIIWTDPEIRTEFTRTMTEDDFVTYLTWPSDDEVTAMFDRLGVGWALVHANLDLEVKYHQTWLRPTYGLEVNHVEALEASDEMCLVDVAAGYRLYRYGDCRPGDMRRLPPDVRIDTATGRPVDPATGRPVPPGFTIDRATGEVIDERTGRPVAPGGTDDPSPGDQGTEGIDPADDLTDDGADDLPDDAPDDQIEPPDPAASDTTLP